MHVFLAAKPSRVLYNSISFLGLFFFLMVVYSSFIVTFGQISRYYPYFIPNSTTELSNPLILLFIQIPLIAFLSLNLLGGLLLATSHFMLSHSFLSSFSSELVALQANLNCALPHFLSWVSFLSCLSSLSCQLYRKDVWELKYFEIFHVWKYLYFTLSFDFGWLKIFIFKDIIFLYSGFQCCY